jgi:hypothetical protein
MKIYSYTVVDFKADEYGQRSVGTREYGQIPMAINLTSQTVRDNINYKDAQYIGLLPKAYPTDGFDRIVINYENGKKLKVLYVNPFGRYK